MADTAKVETDERGVPKQPKNKEERGDYYKPTTKKEKLAKKEAEKIVKGLIQKYGFETARWAIWEEVRYRKHENV